MAYRRMSRLLAITTIVCVMCTGLLVGGAQASTPNRIDHSTTTAASAVTLEPLYKMWNPQATDHYYTASWNSVLGAANGGWQYEGVVCNISSTPNGSPLYELWNPQATDHFYTNSWNEALGAINAGWKYETIVGYLGGTKALYEAWNPTALDHFYSTSMTEILGAANSGWHYEKVEGYCW